MGADAVLRRQVRWAWASPASTTLSSWASESRPVGDHALGQHRPVGRDRMRHGGHGGGLHQRRRVLDRARHPHGARPPGGVRAGVGGLGVGIGGGLDWPGLDREFRNRSPVVGLPRLGRGYRLGASALLRLRRNGLAEQVAGGAGRDRCGRDRLPLRHLCDDGIEQLAGVGGAGSPVQFHARPVAALQHGEAGVEAGAAPCIGAAVDRHGENTAGRGIEAADGIAQDAMGRGDGHQPAARRQHRGGGADMAEVGVVPAAVDAGRRGEGRVHQHDGRADVAQAVGDGLGVERGDHGLRKQPGQKPRTRLGILVEMERTRYPVAQGALGHDRQHPGAGAGLQHDVARPDRGGLERGVGQRQRRRELLEPDLLLGPPCVGGFQRRDRFQHRQHPARPVRPAPQVRRMPRP